MVLPMKSITHFMRLICLSIFVCTASFMHAQDTDPDQIKVDDNFSIEDVTLDPEVSSPEGESNDDNDLDEIAMTVRTPLHLLNLR